MKNEWNELEAAAYLEEPGALIYAVRMLGRDESLGLFGGGNASVKQTGRNLLGEADELIFIDHGQQAPSAIQADGFTALRSNSLSKLTVLDVLPISMLENEIACNRIVATSPIPPIDTLLHAVLPYSCIFLTRPDAILSIANTASGLQRLHKLYGDNVAIVAYAASGLPMAKACQTALAEGNSHKPFAIFVQYQGLFTFGETPQQAYERLVDLISRAEQYLEDNHVWGLPGKQNTESTQQSPTNGPLRHEIARLRQGVSNLAGYPMILTVRDDPESLSYCRHEDLVNIIQAGPAIAAHTALTGRLPLIGRDVNAYRAASEQAIQSAGVELPDEADLAPRILLDPELGLCALGQTASQAVLAARICRHTLGIALRANALDSCQALPLPLLLEAESVIHPAQKDTSLSRAMFTGEIALVTGGASGIGKACVESLLVRGAAVVSLDINPDVTTQYQDPDYLGLVCDLTDEDAILAAFEAMAKTFGGLDMLVLNAGIFPAGCRIEALSLAEWQHVMRINLDSNLVVLREAYPLLKHSPRGGRVLVNASKNVLAPGAGAAAYSASKAAVTQMARVAALEWGKDHIRVNLIHPDAIFDTGIWTEEVLKARAAHYGLTVQQYKTRNVLGVELNSHYVGDLVAEMLGPRFEKITGAQIPVDGGSDRVI
jgi:rhamnose utilization protein RhaD (predicted bifunctional aldolase and dehydrogenase)/NAD(P)-dependent dehydrogenase (short-subunit alcohol dehydrogenase family)